MVNTVHRNGRPARRQRSHCPPETLARLRDWIEREITFVEHPLYAQPDAAALLAAQRPASLDDLSPPPKPEPGLAFIAGMVEAPLLTVEEEAYLFTWMNFLKYRAEQSRQRLNLNQPDGSLLDRIDADIRQAIDVRNRIVRSNLRLVVALARKLSGSLDQMSELIGESAAPLIRSVELFDVGLGNRFSTYATWAVRNHMLRCLKRRRTHQDRMTGHDHAWLDRLPGAITNPEDETRLAAQRSKAVVQLLQSLTEREREVITARFGLNGQPTGQSLRDIAERIGLSKERVRQIAMAAIEKLQGVATTDSLI